MSPEQQEAWLAQMLTEPGALEAAQRSWNVSDTGPVDWEGLLAARDSLNAKKCAQRSKANKPA